MKILQNKKYEQENKQQHSSWKSELVRRNQDLQEKQQIIQNLERKITLIQTQTQKETHQHNQKIQHLESQVGFLRQELVTYQKMLAERGLSGSAAAAAQPLTVAPIAAKMPAPLGAHSKALPLANNYRDHTYLAKTESPALNAPIVKKPAFDGKALYQQSLNQQYLNNPALTAPVPAARAPLLKPSNLALPSLRS
jgi:hypothetical protein